MIVCQQGLQFFPDKAHCGGRDAASAGSGRPLAVATWRSDEEIPFFRELRDVAERHLGPVADQRYRYGEAGSLEALLRDAGFSEVRSKKISRTIRSKRATLFCR